MNKIAIIYWSGSGNTEAMANAIKTGVEQGDEKMPPKIPARNAPVTPFFVFLESR